MDLSEIRNTLCQMFLQTVHMLRVFPERCTDFLRGGTQSRDSRNIVRSGTHSILLPASIDQRIYLHPLIYEQKSGSLGPMDFVSADGKHIYLHSLWKDRILSEGLYRVYMEKSTRIPAAQHFSDFRHRLHRSDLIIHHHDGHQYRILRHCILQIMKIQNAVSANRKLDNLIAHSLQCRGRSRDRRMLNRCSDNPSASAPVRERRPEQRPVIGLRSAGCKINLARIHLQNPGQNFRASPDIFFRIDTLLMHGGRIAVILQHRFSHDIRNLLIAAGCC